MSAGVPARRRLARRAALAALGLAVAAGLAHPALASDPPEPARDPEAALHADCSACDLAARLDQAWRWRNLRRGEAAPSFLSVHAQPDGRLVAIDTEGAWLHDGLTWEQDPGWRGLAHAPYLHAELRDGDLLLFHPRRTTRIPPRAHPAAPDRAHALLVAEPGRTLCAPLELRSGDFLQPDGAALWRVSARGEPPAALPLPPGVGALACVVRDRSGRLWLAGEQGLYRHEPDGSWSGPHAVDRELPECGGRAHGLALDAGPVFLPSLAEPGSPGLVVTDAGARELPPWPRTGVVSHAVVSPEGVLVVALRYAGLLVLDGDRWLAVGGPPGADGSVAHLAFLGDGRLVAASHEGVLRTCDLRSDAWEQVSLAEAGLGGLVTDLQRASRGGLWAATLQGLARVVDGRVVEVHTRAGDTGASLAHSTTLLDDGAGGLWVGGERFPGLLHLGAEGWRVERDHPELQARMVQLARRAPDGRLHLLLAPRPGEAPSEGLLLARDDAGWRSVGPPASVLRGPLRDLAWRADGTPLLLARYGLLALRDGAWAELPRPLRLRAGYAAVHVDGQDRVWLAYDHREPGLAWLEPGADAWTEPRGAGWERAAGAHFAETTDGRLWVTSERGLALVHRGLASSIDTRLVLRESAFGPVVADESGDGLWIGSLGDGLLHHRPDDHAPPGALAIDVDAPRGLAAGEREVHWGASDHWGATRARDLRFQYRVDGGPWLPEEGPAPLSRASLVDLRPGRHRFELTVLDGMGNRAAQPVVRDFEVPVPFWLSLPVLLLGTFTGLALLALIVLWARRRKERREAAQAEQELNRRLRWLASRLMSEQEAERKRVARDLHDELGQSLAAASMHLQLLARVTEPERRDACRARAREALDDAIAHMRRLSQRLRPPVLDDHGLEAAVRSLVRDFAATTHHDVSLDVDLEGAALDDQVADHLYRILGECLTNIQRHAHAERVDILLTRRSGELLLSVRDDGVGADPDRTRGRGIGLLGMQERAESLGGRLVLRSQRGRSTLVRVSIPEHGPPAGTREPIEVLGGDRTWQPSASSSSTTTR